MNRDPKPKAPSEDDFDQFGDDPTASPASLSDAVVGARDLLKMEISQREPLLGEWAREGDFGYLYAPRGHGKTWMAMLTANAMCCALPLGEWKAGTSKRHVVYFDAEMNLPDVKERAFAIEINSTDFDWIQNEIVAQKLKRPINIVDTEDQKAISALVKDGGILVIDNLSTAACGMAENDNDEFDLIKKWLLDFRARRVAVIIVHHSGRNGQMRGASRREDMAHWIISLKDDSPDGGHEKVWITEFVKCRNCTASLAPPLRWTMKIKEGKLVYDCKPHAGHEAMLMHIEAGIDSASALAEEMGVTRGCVSKWAKKLETSKQIIIEGRKYLPKK